jgi:beta-mannosidase
MKFYQSWMGRSCHPERNAWFPATVPGNIQKDYAVANGFADVQYADNYKQFLPLEDDHWEYRTELRYDAKKGERVIFVSEGISYKYDVLLNGETLFSYEGMFRGFELELTDKLTGKNDVLTVHIYPHPKSQRGQAGTRDEANESCNPPVYYGWDWNPRLLISGIWDDTYIETRSESYIGNTEVLSAISDDLQLGTVTCSFDCALPCEILLLDAEGNEVYRGSDKQFTVSAPALWWCNGQGTPYLYTWVIRNEKEERTGKLGFRRLRLLRNTGATGPKTFPKGRYEAPITVELNNRRIFCKGSNWVNPELFWGEITTKRYEELIRLAKECHMNIFRMWGGAGTPKRAFYDICDREGILLWQEFVLACNEYIDVGNYMQVLESEATGMIKKFRSHPCLAFWCGGNELFNAWSNMDEQYHPLRLLNKLCFELDYKRPFLYTSPLYGMAHGGYVFYSEDQGGDVFQQFQSNRNTAYTEFGVPSLSDVETLKQIIPGDELFPIKPTEAWIAHHGFKAWGAPRWVCQDIYERYFGTPNSLEELVAGQQWMQCEGYRGAFEEMRRQWPHCSMGINWDYNEPWITAAGNELIAYPAKINPCYYYVQKAMRPTLFSAKIPKFDWKEGETFEAELWLLNDAPEAREGRVHVTARVGDEEFDLLDWNAKTDANAHKRGPTVRFVLPHAEGENKVVLTLAAENGMESEYVFMYIPKKKKKVLRQLNV